MKKEVTDKMLGEALAMPTVAEAANHLLSEGCDLKKGCKVAILNDPIYGQEGIAGIVEGPSGKGGGYVDVRLKSGIVVPMMCMLLAPL